MLRPFHRRQRPQRWPPDCRLFLDLDLSVLEAGPEEFDAYEAGVRHDYSHIAEGPFRAGRAATLERFLKRDRFYLSEWGAQKFETKARMNLIRSLKALRSGQGRQS